MGRRSQWSRGPNHGYIVTNREYYRDRRLCRDFTHEVIADLPDVGFELDREQVLSWLDSRRAAA